jgi:FtsH-binding integral membrane protein
MGMERFGMRSAQGFRMSAEVSAKGVTAFLQRVYGWIFAGLAITVLVAFRLCPKSRFYD